MAQSFNRRQEGLACGSREGLGEYNLSFQIGALFIILAVSGSACVFPLLATKIPGLKLPRNFLFVVRHFGTGVLLATAFVHLLPTAFISLTNPCLPKFWNETYPAMAGAIALASVFAITSVEMLLSPGRKSCCTRIEDAVLSDEKLNAYANERSGIAIEALGAQELGPLHGRVKIGRSSSNGRGFTRIIQEALRPHTVRRSKTSLPVYPVVTQPVAPTTPENNDNDATHSSSLRNRASLQCILLEIGILFHSIFIGMSLAVSTGQNLIILLTAITFHQLFEGLALGSRIASIDWSRAAPADDEAQTQSRSSLKPYLMTIAYACTTPLGQALGISTHTLYDPDSQAGLLVVGIMNAISAGLLTYTSLVDLLGEDFLSDESWRVLNGKRRVVAFGLVVGGAGSMGVVGGWA